MTKSKQEYFKEYTLTSNKGIDDISVYSELRRDELKSLIQNMLKSNKSIKGQLSLGCVYQETLVNGEIQETTIHYGLRATDIYNIGDFLTSEFQTLVFRYNLNQPAASSGWTLLTFLDSFNITLFSNK